MQVSQNVVEHDFLIAVVQKKVNFYFVMTNLQIAFVFQFCLNLRNQNIKVNF